MLFASPTGLHSISDSFKSFVELSNLPKTSSANVLRVFILSDIYLSIMGITTVAKIANACVIL